ncbi:ABC transporter permease [Moritella sp. 24]|uniref:ABC transporter permease n=1 Tax=Moritella sp. 24 TaxID=2746230 RepID=UPI001BA660C0|nr:ABC transporter permease [Moritella sp. 24]QUM76854.1 ABC transporter permease [Moritella sp. 24]
MSSSVQVISFTHLAFAFIPVLVALGILVQWRLPIKNGLYALSRMLIQLLLIGYFLSYIFESHSAGIVVGVLIVMVVASSWIALGAIPEQRWKMYKYALLSVTLGGGFTLLVMSAGVLGLDPWYNPQYMVPLAGMAFANAMNSVSLSAERLNAEMSRGDSYIVARKIALKASLIPITNALFAVGLVSLPGMMTGQILSGVSPFIAVRYQIMIMCMLFGSSVISAALFLSLIKPLMLTAKIKVEA